jgi:hypothetical protein
MKTPQTLSRDQQIENCLVAQAMMSEIDDDALNLQDWSNDQMRKGGVHACGAAACFGGYIGRHRYFQEVYGVEINKHLDDFPTIKNLHNQDLGNYLFGAFGMFHPNSTGISDKKIVLRRLDKALQNLLEPPRCDTTVDSWRARWSPGAR